MAKRIKGLIKSCSVPGSDEKGYRDTWDTGTANMAKKNIKVTGPNRPGT
ncbi:MAG: hypothetical protein K6T80_02385 [Firmicutes bacterium]|nr:hypothetical protein [Bacillota bacterium]